MKELQTAMYDYYQAIRSARERDQYNHEMPLYIGDNSDGSVGSKKRWSNNKKSLRNNPREKREYYGCGKKGHIKHDCRSTSNKKAGSARRSMDCNHCKKKGYQESKCWRKHPEKTPIWLQKKNKDNEIAGFAIDGETAFMSLSDVILVETVNKEDSQYTHEISDDEEDNAEPPPLKERNYDDKSSVYSNEGRPSID